MGYRPYVSCELSKLQGRMPHDARQSRVAIPRLAKIIPDMGVQGLQALVNAGTVQELQPGTQIFEQGSPHTRTSIIVEGLVRVYYVSPDGKESTLSYWSEGDIVGGPDLFGKSTHIWSGKALKRTLLLSLSGSCAHELARSHPEILWWCHTKLAEKLRWVSILYQLLGNENVRKRLARLLLLLCDSHGTPCGRGTLIRHWVKQADIATLVGSSRQWTNRALQDFRRMGLIDIKDRHIIVSNIKGLRDILEETY